MGSFDLNAVIGAIQNEYPATDLEDYLNYYQKSNDQTLEEELNKDIEGFPATFYVVETNNVDLIKCWIQHGADPNITHGPRHFPLLAFAALRGAQTRDQATKTIETLLRLGASHEVIPHAYYDKCNRDLPSAGPDLEELEDIDEDGKQWCTEEALSRLASRLNVSQRYRLWQTSNERKPSGRERVLAERKGAEQVLGLHLTIIGQNTAAAMLKQSILM